MFSLWNPPYLQNMALPPCAWCAQFYVSDGVLSCKLTQRSSDIVLAGGWNIAQYALLTHLLAKVCDLMPGELIWSPGDTHIYMNQLEAAGQIIERRPRPFPQVCFVCDSEQKSGDNLPEQKSKSALDRLIEFEWENVVLVGYDPIVPQIKIPMNA